MTGATDAFGPADTGGIPWSGRTVSGTGFDHDHGAADPAVLRALEQRAAGPSVEHDSALMRRVHAARWIVPIVAVPAVPAVPAEHGEADGPAAKASTDMAVVTLAAPNGRRALPIFTSVAALSAWDPTARPVPVTASRAAQAAVSEGCEVLVVDVAGSTPTELRPSMVWALSQDRDWLPSHLDPFVARAISGALEQEDAVVGHAVEDGGPVAGGVLRVVLRLVPGLAQRQVQSLATRIAERLATDGEFRARVDELTFALTPADAT